VCRVCAGFVHLVQLLNCYEYSLITARGHHAQNVVRSGVPASVMRYIRRCAEAFGFPRTQLCDSQQTHTELLAQMEVLSAVTCQLEQYTQLQQQHEDSGTGRDISISEAATVLRFLRRRWAVNAVVHLGDYVEALGSIIHVTSCHCPGLHSITA
jgi:hypothetical protein